MNKGAKIAGVAVLSTAVIIGVTKVSGLLRKKDAGGKLVLNLEKVNVNRLAGMGEIDGLSINIPKGVTIGASFSIKNPTNEKLSFTKPYIKLLWTNKDGKKVQFADSPVSTEMIDLLPKKDTAVNINLEAQFLNLMRTVPDAAIYFLARVRGMEPNRSIEAQWEYTTENISLSDSKIIKV